MIEPTTRAGKALVGVSDGWPGIMREAFRALVTRAEAEARQGYVPASLSPEWHAELTYTAEEARQQERDRIAAEVEALPRHACEPCEPDPSGYMLARPDVLRIVKGEQP